MSIDKRIFILCTVFLCACANSKNDGGVKISSLITLDTCFNKGVAAMYCGFAGDNLIVAGGANFPHSPVADGGVKVFYDNIFTLSENGEWKAIGSLNLPAASGATIADDESLYFIGGMNSHGALGSVTRYRYEDERLISDILPSLPYGVEQCGAAMVDDVIYVIGGSHDGTPAKQILALDTRCDSVAKWRCVGELPEAILQPVVVALDGVIYIWGGYLAQSDTQRAKVYDYGYKFKPEMATTAEFTKISGAPSGTMTGASATIRDGKIYSVGGVQKDIFDRALVRRYEINNALGAVSELLDEEETYMELLPPQYKFTSTLQMYDPVTDSWSVVLADDNLALAGAGVAAKDDKLFVVNGEIKPGVRTNRVLEVDIK